MKNKYSNWIFGAVCALGMMIMTESGRAIPSITISATEWVIKGSSAYNPDPLNKYVGANYPGLKDPISMLYKFDGNEEGSMSASYSAGLTGKSAKIESDNGEWSINQNPVFGYVKAGKDWWLFDLTGLWDGKETLTFSGFTNDVSAVGIYGVPDGGMTIALLGLGLWGLGATLRFIRI